MTGTLTRHPAAQPPRAAMLCVSLALVGALGAAGRAHAQSSTDDLARLLSHQARIEGGSDASLSRVPLTEEVLRIARADLSDVRVVGPQGTPVPYLIDSGARPLPTDVPLRMSAPLVDARESRDGSRREPGLYRERFVIAAPSAAPAGALWFLELGVPHERWVRQVRMVANEGTDSEQLVYEGSLFHLPTPTRARESVSVPNLPAGALITVELSGDDFFVTPSFTWVARRAYEGAPQLTIPLAIESSRRDGTQTLVTLRRPPGVLPDRIRITTSTLDFHRSVQVRDARPGEVSRSIGRGEIYRVQMLADAHVDELNVDAARGETIELVFDDADSPPLADLAVEALVVAPSLVARIADGSTLRFGGARVSAPHYDLSALLGRDAGDRLLRSALPTLRLAEVQPSPSFDASPALSFAMHPGRAVDPVRFAMRATLEVNEAREGLTRIEPSAALLSAAQIGLGDLRIVDEQNRQWPYFLGDSLVDVQIDLSIGPASRHDDWTHVVLTPSVARVHSHTLELDVDADYFDRQMRLIGIDSETGEERILVNQRVSRTPGSRAAITLSGPDQRVSAWRLEIHDADDAPLELRAARATTRTPEIFLVAPQGSYGVLVGDAEASAPSYELSRVRSVVLQIPAAGATLSELSPNPTHRVPSWHERAGSATLALWGALLLAVLVLGGLTLRLARMPQPVETSPATPDPLGASAVGGAEREAAQPSAEAEAAATPATAEGSDGDEGEDEGA